ncbi:kynureninase [Streptomyces spectabilis]|uniref:Kynureninase n=1 Tax=Streptomyces spectabilis TaxID=68270 RepID=A0A5P2XF94_STRST|nr:kynureninase [Streptomyces spectabilis]MBB5103711.1 kynureninase [Streptomyces spectabilis]MCI3904047.1 kynureninase [Streptomyces spectabilis]QEV61186.1 kynureninase [Streptomyces spectabilis]GGV19246.1 kynureninase [Streptomyces spectabilis]
MSEPREADLRVRAAALDAADGLAAKRKEFVLDATVYLDGNSLGALPANVAGRVADVVTREWGGLRIRSWEESGWWTAPERVGERIAPLIGAGPGQVVVSDSTSVNVFKAVVAAVRMAQADDPARDEVVVDATTFPTDGYIAESAARLTGCRLVPAAPADVPGLLGPRTAAVLLNHADYQSGRLHDMAGLTAAVRAAGARVVWDLCHTAGALPVALDEHGVDLAVGCTYKYLNGGPGSPSYLYVRRDLQSRFDSPLPGWNSHTDPFGMRPDYEPAADVVRGRVGTPDILSLLALEAALDVWDGVSLDDVRAKSLALTDFFLECVAAYVPEGRVESVTPAAHAERGSQIALRCPDAREVMPRLVAAGVVGDFRAPDVLRFGFTPLYVSFADTERAARVLGGILGGFGELGPEGDRDT